MTKSFEDIIAQANAADAHNQEIINSRVGGFGGSDAKLLHTIGKNGVEHLSNTDKKRIAIAMGLIPQEDHVDNMYTRAGHAFEDYLSGSLAGWEREKVLSMPIAKNFKTFAHADFCKEHAVLELKYSQHPLNVVLSTYQYQFQWYYMLGMSKVFLVHGQGDVEPFEVKSVNKVPVQPNEKIINTILNGIFVLDEAISNGWQPEVKEFDEMPAKLPRLVDLYLRAKAAEDKAKKKADKYKEQIRQAMEASDIKACQGVYKDCMHTAQITTTAGRRTFDSKAFLADHPEFDLEKYYKVSKESTSINIK